MLKKYFILYSILIVTQTTVLLPKDRYRPENFGLIAKDGKINKVQMTKSQKDTIVFGFFNYEDFFEDIAIYFKSKEQIKIFRNCGNGFAEEWRTIKSDEKNIKSITALPPIDYMQNPNQRWDIEINYENGTSRIIKNRIILNPDYIENKAPTRNFLDDPKAFLYDITFIEQWRSGKNYQPVWHIEAGDIDKDGKNEAIYTFYPRDESNYPTHLVIFECVNQNQYRIDWDSVYEYGGFYNLNFPFTDFDRNGKLEFFSMGKDPFEQREIGLFECYGEGVYKYMHTNITSFGFPMEVNLLDSATIGDTTAPGFWILYSWWGSSNNYTEFQKFRLKKKYPSVFEFQPYINGYLQGNDYLVYSMSASDIDKDGKEEIVEGDTQWGTGYIGYWDSTGASTHKGYTYKVIYPGAPISGGYLIGKDLDGDKYKEITACGIGDGTGSIGIVKHTGTPGENQFSVVWWDSTGIEAMPNYGIDSGSINGKYSILYPTYDTFSGDWPIDRLFLILYTRNGLYNFYQSCRTVKDSMTFLDAKICDMDNDGKINIMAPIFYFLDIGKYSNYLTDWEQIRTVGLNPLISSNIPKGYKLFQNYPNPFNQFNIISFELMKDCFVKLEMYDLSGKLVYLLLNQKQNKGKHSVRFNGINLASGIYFYSLIINGKRIDSKKMLLIK